MKKFYTLLLFVLAFFQYNAQDTTEFSSSNIALRPLNQFADGKLAIGGYVEANTNYFREDGISEGISFEMRRTNLFINSQISPKIRFISELEFEHGTEEIALETALMDFQLHPLLNFRGGIILPTIGWFNANHDSPNWEFIERPLVSEHLIPATLNEVGFGFFGKYFFTEKTGITYDFYLTNGLQEGIIDYASGRTYIPGGKTAEILSENNNGRLFQNVRIGLTTPFINRIGIAYYGGTYNRFRIEGDQVANPLNIHLYALDFQKKWGKLNILGEAAWSQINLKPADVGFMGSKQFGYHVDFIYALLKKPVFGFEESVINLALRVESVDWNMDLMPLLIDPTPTYGDQQTGFQAGINWRPVANTIFKFSYGRYQITDYLNNDPAILGSYQFGLASYF